MDISRKGQVLDRLLLSVGEWVDGPALANERVGGPEGHRRIRELRADGYQIENRRHPDRTHRYFQYMLVSDQKVGADGVPIETSGVSGPLWRVQWACEVCGSAPMDRPVVGRGDRGVARCATCQSRQKFRPLAA